MKRLSPVLFGLFLPLAVVSQSLSESQQKAINAYIVWVNHLTQQVSNLGSSLVQPYRQASEVKARSSWIPNSYSCKLSASDYYYTETAKSSSVIGTQGAAFLSAAASVREAYQQLDASCKQLEIYYRLNDYESDQYKKAAELVRAMTEQITAYAQRVQAFHDETEKLIGKLQPYSGTSAYSKADKLMRDQLVFEKKLSDAWNFNVYESVHTGWPSESAQQHIRDNQVRINTLKQGGGGVQYPASSMYKSFVDGVVSLQDVKRAGVDGYTYEKWKSDEHGNYVYNQLLNYYNNDCIAFYNNYIDQSRQHGYRGVYYLYAVPQFSVRSDEKKITLAVQPFRDQTISALRASPASTPVTSTVHGALTNYILLINEGMRQINFMSTHVRNMNSSAASAMTRVKAGQAVSLSYYNTKFELPVTLYQKTVDQTSALPQAYRASLLQQAEVLNGILLELNQWNTLLLAESSAKQLAKDSLTHVYSFLDRYVVLIHAFDEKKERLYGDIRRIFEAHPYVDPKSSWQVSGTGLQQLLDEDHTELQRVRNFFTETNQEPAQTQRIEELARALLTNEYTNLTGIQKLGRSNGLCPYSPYEDLAEYSRRFAEALVSKRQSKTTSTRHPYSELIYQYNQILVENYNKFAELSKVPLLKSVFQLDWFAILPPVEPEVTAQPQTAAVPVAAAQSGKEAKPVPVVVQTPAQTKSQPHSASSTSIQRDTVYVSRVDTVYIGLPGEDIRSMNGYATNNLVILLDVSASMNQSGRFSLLKESLYQLMDMMRPEDKIAIITYSGKARIALLPTSFTEKEKIKAAIDQLTSEGKTDGNAGIKMAYKVADDHYLRGGNNRIILATDGEFPIGKPTYELVKKFSGEDIYLTVFNFGKFSSATKNLQQLAETGKGSYALITPGNAELAWIREVKAKRKN
jgi:Ca-activated chloride channel homolog